MSEVKRYSPVLDSLNIMESYILSADHDRIVAELNERCARLAARCNSLTQALNEVADERESMRAEVERMRKDAERYRFVRELAWYVDQAAYVYEVGNSHSPWSNERAPVDADDVEQAIDAAMEAGR